MTYDIELLRVFHNSPADLDANRAGRLGAGQVRRLRRGARNAVLAMVGIALVFAAIIVFVAAHPIQPWRWVLIGLVILGAVTVGVHRGTQLRRAVRDGSVVCLTGSVRVAMRGRSGWWLTVDGRSFHLPVRFWHVGPGLEYRVYAAPAAELIVSMEPCAPVRPDLATLAGTPTTFAATGDGEHPYATMVGGAAVLVRVNDFPAEPMYSVFADGAHLGDLDDWPAAWTRPLTPANLRDLAARTPGGAQLLAVTAPLDPTALRAWATILCLTDAADTTSVLRALRFTGTLTAPGMSDRRLDPPVAHTASTDIGERDGELTGVRLRPGTIPVTRGALDAEFGAGQELVRVHWDSAHRVIYRFRIDKAPFTCDITASFGEPPAPGAVATEIDLRRLRS